MKINSLLLTPSPSLFSCFCVAWDVLRICYELVKLFPVPCPGTLALHCTKAVQVERKGIYPTSNFVLHGPTWTFLGQEYFALSAAQQALESNVHRDVNNVKWLFSIAETRQDKLHLLALRGLQFFPLPLLPLPRSQPLSVSAVCLTAETHCSTLVSATLVAVLF